MNEWSDWRWNLGRLIGREDHWERVWREEEKKRILELDWVDSGFWIYHTLIILFLSFISISSIYIITWLLYGTDCRTWLGQLTTPCRLISSISTERLLFFHLTPLLSLPLFFQLDYQTDILTSSSYSNHHDKHPKHRRNPPKHLPPRTSKLIRETSPNKTGNARP